MKEHTRPTLRIGMLGMWGMNVPGRRFAGFESAFSEIAPRLVESGHEVVIYCRRGEYAPERRIPMHQGVRLVYLPSPGGKNLSAVVNTLFAVLHAVLVERFDLLFFVNVGMGHHCALARLLGQRVVLNVDGLDWTRDKWGRIAKAYFYSAAKMAVRVCTRLVTDAEAMRRFYLEHFGRDSTMIAYGTYVTDSTRPERVQELGLAPREYWLIVSRMIPENSLDTMLEAYVQSGSLRPLVVVGGATYDSPFHRRLREIAARADGRIRFLGHVHDEELLRELWCNCFGYLHGHSVGGTNPALLNAMGYGSCILALDTVFNREVLGGTGLLFPADPTALAAMLQSLEQDPARAAAMREPPRARVRAEYSWEKITRQYEELFLEVAE
ncbi:MAG TPA: glycosyltransferase [Gemmatimonadaceae bacterium]|nr:glycosyltransferase [Gemmatimonadaceae bacterium]